MEEKYFKERGPSMYMWRKFIVMDFGWKARCGRNHTQSSPHLIAYVLYIYCLLGKRGWRVGADWKGAKQRGSGPNDWLRAWKLFWDERTRTIFMYSSCACPLRHMTSPKMRCLFTVRQHSLIVVLGGRISSFSLCVAWLLLFNIILYHLSWSFAYILYGLPSCIARRSYCCSPAS